MKKPNIEWQDIDVVNIENKVWVDTGSMEVRVRRGVTHKAAYRLLRGAWFHDQTLRCYTFPLSARQAPRFSIRDWVLSKIVYEPTIGWELHEAA